MKTSSKSGRIWLTDGEVHYESQDYGSWSFPVADIRVFGEYTTDHGPMIDDWFMVFVTSSAYCWFEASVYGEGVEEFLEQLAAVLGADSLNGELFASTQFDSRVTLATVHARAAAISFYADSDSLVATDSAFRDGRVAGRVVTRGQAVYRTCCRHVILRKVRKVILQTPPSLLDALQGHFYTRNSDLRT